MKMMCKTDIKKLLEAEKMAVLTRILHFSYHEVGLEELDYVEHSTKFYNNRKKVDSIETLITLLTDEVYLKKLEKTVSSDKLVFELYNELTWFSDTVDIDEEKYKELVVNKSRKTNFGLSYDTGYLDNSCGLVHIVYRGYHKERYTLQVDAVVNTILRCVLPQPKEFNLISINDNELSKSMIYENESGVLDFISVIEPMIKSDILQFNSNKEKPLKATLNVLASGTSCNEFYKEPKMNQFAVDMLTRSFYYYRFYPFLKEPHRTLETFFAHLFENQFHYILSKMFITHLKGIKRFKDYYPEHDLFNTMKKLLLEFPTDDSWVSIENIYSIIKIRKYKVNTIEDYRLEDAYIVVEDECGDEDYYGPTDRFHVHQETEELYTKPLIKGAFFYFAALGVVKLNYGQPLSSVSFAGKGKAYISPWDGLTHIQLTDLGKYIFNHSDSYCVKEIKKKKTTVKFDEYKPIITVDANDTITKLKLDLYANELTKGKYELSPSKIFKDCNKYKDLEFRIEGFYKNIESTPPQVFNDFFNALKAKANILKKESTKIVISLKDDKDLLQLFMSDKRLQDITVKAEGLRVIVEKKELSKLTKIVKENGFFLEF